jgi:hypothetical protein
LDDTLGRRKDKTKISKSLLNQTMKRKGSVKVVHPTLSMSSAGHGHGRLAVTAIDSAMVRVLGLPTKAVLKTIQVTATPSAIYASGDARYAAVVQRTQDLVQFIDGGLWQEVHGSHKHDREAEPRLMPFQLTQSRPTHFQQAPDQASHFYFPSTSFQKNCIDCLPLLFVVEGHLL